MACAYCQHLADESGEHVDVDHDTEDCERRESDGESFWDRIWSGDLT